MMGPEFWKPQSPAHLARCSERVSNSCTEETDGCCAVVPCSYCLEWIPDSGPRQYGVAESGGSAWTGTVAGAAFVAYWERDPYNECTFYVYLDGEYVYAKTCANGQVCRNSSDSAITEIGGYPGTLRWDRREHRPLHYVTGADKCVEHVCGGCECTCGFLCATLIGPAPECCTVKFKLMNTNYDCSAPVWSGSVTCDDVEYSISLTLSKREEDGACLLTGTFNGDPVEPVALSACIGWTAGFTTYDGTVISVECDPCECDPDPGCGVGCCWPLIFNSTYPCGYRIPVPFEISAPGCAIDGFSSEFVPSGVAPRGDCGACGAAPPVGISGGLIGAIKVPVPDFGYCMDTPCSVIVDLILECDDDASVNYGSDECCGRFRLWVGTSERMIGHDGTSPPGSSQSLYWIKIAPSSCSCTPGGGGFSAIFEVSLMIDCTETYVGGPCDGKPKGCCDPICKSFVVSV